MDLVKIKADEEFHWGGGGQNNNERSNKSMNI
jgi:hypothetical protein